MSAPELSVAVCTHNPQQATFERVLDAIVPQLRPPVAAELIVIDNNSSPPLAELDYLRGYPVRLISETKPGLTAARAAALRAAAGAIVVFVDDDNVLADGYLAEVSRVFADPALGLLGGSVTPEYETALPKWAREFEGLLAVRRYDAETYRETIDLPYSEYFPVGAGFAVRRSLGLAYLEDCAKTGWIEGRRGAELSAGEDTDLGLFVLDQGSKLAVTGKLRVTHVIPRARVTRDYLARLLVGILRSSWELEAKWAPRFGRPVFAVLRRNLLNVLARAAVTGVLGLWSPRYRIKRGALMELARLKVHSGPR